MGTSLWGGFFPHGEAHEGRNDDDPRERLRQGGGARAGAMTAEHLGHPTAPAPLGRRSGAQWMRTRRSRSISAARHPPPRPPTPDRKSTRLNSSHRCISYAVFCLKKKNENT